MEKLRLAKQPGLMRDNHPCNVLWNQTLLPVSCPWDLTKRQKMGEEALWSHLQP